MATDLEDPRTLDYRFDADHDGAVWLARQLCEQWLRDHRVRADAIPDLLLVATELCTGAAADVELRIRLEADDVEVVVESAAPVPGTPAGDLRLAAALCDEVTIRVLPGRSVTRARLHGAVLPPR